MPGDFPMQDPRQIWRDQPTEPLKMSRAELRHKAVKLQSKARFAALFTMIIGIVFCVFFAWWSLAGSREMLARMGFGLMSLCMIYAAYHVYKWTWPRDLPEDAPIGSCIEFYRRELERQRDYAFRWWRSGLPLLTLLGMVMAVAGTGARKAALQHPLLNAVPFFLILAVWVAAFLFIRKKNGQRNLQQEIDELRRFEAENR